MGSVTWSALRSSKIVLRQFGGSQSTRTEDTGNPINRSWDMATTSLRAVTHRLTTTPVQQLPPIASFLATSLSDCGELLSAPQNQKAGKSESDNAVQIHKLKTRLGSLLQDRSFEGRWTAVVLVKATVEAGQWEILRGCEPIVRSMIGILAVSCWDEGCDIGMNL